MGMSERGRQALGSIEDGLAGSDPALASMLGIFSRLTSGEEMPAREKIQVGRRAVHSPRRARRRPHHGTALRRVGLLGSVVEHADLGRRGSAEGVGGAGDVRATKLPGTTRSVMV